MRNNVTPKTLWDILRQEAAEQQKREPVLASMLAARVLDHQHFADALSSMLAVKLGCGVVDPQALATLCVEAQDHHPAIKQAAQMDLIAIMERDPAAKSVLSPFLFFKGYSALQAHRIAHSLWQEGRFFVAEWLQSAVSACWQVDIHPAARIGHGIMMDHATGIVIGETAVIGHNVSLLHAVTLGGTGHEQGDRHPKIGSDVMIGAGAKILGNITVGDGARIAAGSVVLKPVPPCVTVAGVPARIIGDAGCEKPAVEMDQMLPADCIVI